jgi:hypothetical protein
LENLTGKMDTMFHALGALFLALAVLPFVDRGAERHPARRKGVLTIAGLVVLAMIGLTVYAAVAPPQLHEHEHGTAHEAPAPPRNAETPQAVTPGASPSGANHHDETPHAHEP